MPSFRSVRRLLQTKGPSGSRLNSSTVPIRFWVLSTVQRLMLLRNPSQGNLWYRNSWVSTLNALCIFQGLRLCRFWMVQASWASLQVETRNLFSPGTSWNLQTENQAWQSATLSYNPPETQTHAKLKTGTVFFLTGEARKLIFGSFGMEGGNEQRSCDFETPLFSQASWSFHPVWTKSWLLNASEWRMMLELPSWQTQAGANQLKIFSRRMPHCASLWAPGPWLIFRSRSGGVMT